MNFCGAIDGTQFEDPQEQGFEDIAEQQQLFEEGKWCLIKYTHFLYMHACVYNMMDPKLRICLVFF
jgi:hypothetical protein